MASNQQESIDRGVAVSIVMSKQFISYSYVPRSPQYCGNRYKSFTEPLVINTTKVSASKVLCLDYRNINLLKRCYDLILLFLILCRL